ncbi:MAG: hypothetical protein ACRD8W_00460 [Nitrososphaeraceae archaeon]
MKQIEAERTAQVAGTQQFGTDMDTRLQGIYGQLVGAQQQGVQTTRGIYDTASKNIASAYGGGSDIAAAGSQQVQSQISSLAQRLGLGDKALSEVSGRLGEQAAGFQFRNQASAADRLGTMQQLGASMSGVMEMGVSTARQAMAQGRDDLARRVAGMIAKINSSAAGTRADFTGIKAQQTQQALMEAQKEMMRAQRELAAEQRSAARAASRSSAAGGLDWMTKFMLQNEENDRRYNRDNPDDPTINMNRELANRVGQFASPNTIMHFQAAASSNNPMGYIAKLDPKQLKKEGVSKEKLTKWVSGLL